MDQGFQGLLLEELEELLAGIEGELHIWYTNHDLGEVKREKRKEDDDVDTRGRGNAVVISEPAGI